MLDSAVDPKLKRGLEAGIDDSLVFVGAAKEKPEDVSLGVSAGFVDAKVIEGSAVERVDSLILAGPPNEKDGVLGLPPSVEGAALEKNGVLAAAAGDATVSLSFEAGAPNEKGMLAFLLSSVDVLDGNFKEGLDADVSMLAAFGGALKEKFGTSVFFASADGDG